MKKRPYRERTSKVKSPYEVMQYNKLPRNDGLMREFRKLYNIILRMLSRNLYGSQNLKATKVVIMLSGKKNGVTRYT